MDSKKYKEYTATEWAKQIGVSRPTVYAHCKKGLIKYKLIGNPQRPTYIILIPIK